MIRYAQIDIETGIPECDSMLSGEVDLPNMIEIDEDFDLTNKKYINGEWVEYTPEPVIEEPSEQDTINAELLLNQAQIISSQGSMDEVLAEILLNQIGG